MLLDVQGEPHTFSGMNTHRLKHNKEYNTNTGKAFHVIIFFFFKIAANLQNLWSIKFVPKKSELPDSNTKPYTIGIVGGSASGKTELLHQLHGSFKSEEVSLLSQDDYHKPIEHQKKAENETVNFDLPEAIEADQLIQNIQQLKQGNRVTVREYTFNQPGIKSKEKTIHPSPILLIEGLFLF